MFRPVGSDVGSLALKCSSSVVELNLIRDEVDHALPLAFLRVQRTESQ